MPYRPPHEADTFNAPANDRCPGMQMQQSSKLMLSVAFVLSAMAVGPASPASRLSPFTHMQCMESVLHKLPSISQVKSGVLSIDGQVHPFVQYYYRASGPASRSGYVRFEGSNANKTDATRTYLARINGLTTPGTEPADYGTRLVVDQWRLACKVDASALWE
jgi:hypothetical protein